MIDLLGLLVFLTIVGIGLLDMQSGLGPFAMYRSATVTSGHRWARTGPRGDDNQTRPPEPAL